MNKKIIAQIVMAFQDVWEEEAFVPKKAKNPAREKFLDCRRARNNMQWIKDRQGSRPPHEVNEGFTSNGMPYFDWWKDGRTRYHMHSFRRARWMQFERKTNGKQEYMGKTGDAWAKPFIQGKSSRYMQHQKQLWYEQAYEEIEDREIGED